MEWNVAQYIIVFVYYIWEIETSKVQRRTKRKKKQRRSQRSSLLSLKARCALANPAFSEVPCTVLAGVSSTRRTLCCRYHWITRWSFLPRVARPFWSSRCRSCGLLSGVGRAAVLRNFGLRTPVKRRKRARKRKRSQSASKTLSQ